MKSQNKRNLYENSSSGDEYDDEEYTDEEEEEYDSENYSSNSDYLYEDGDGDEDHNAPEEGVELLTIQELVRRAEERDYQQS